MTDGGPAFPVLKHYENGHIAQVSEGMTLRDWLAGMAMQALVRDNYFDVVATKAYMMADLMLKERLK